MHSRRLPFVKNSCNRCGVNLPALETEIRELRERLEYSELQNLKLSHDLKRLRKELQAAEFKGRPTLVDNDPWEDEQPLTQFYRILPPSAIRLPDEIFRHIFMFAVHLDDLVSPFWNGYDTYTPWLISARARRSIPLVCRQWYNAGVEYLYEHIVLSHPAQVDALQDHLQYLTQQPKIHTERLHWIRGVEFVMHMVEWPQLEEVMTKACQLIHDLPSDRLRAFGLEHGCCKYPAKGVTSLVAAGILKGRGSLETLHVPCMTPEVVIFDCDLLSPGNNSATSKCVGFPRLCSLSLTSGWWELCSGKGRWKHPIIPLLTHQHHSIHTLSLNLSTLDTSPDVLLGFLTVAVQLESITVIVGPFTSLLREEMNLFFGAIPNLRRLSIGASNRHNRIVPTVVAGQCCHEKLEEIFLLMESTSNVQGMLILQPLFSQIFAGNFPALMHIVLRGVYPEGCLDAKEIFSAEHLEQWRHVIEGCRNRGVDLVSEEGDPIHLWHDRHALKIDTAEGESWEDSSSSDGSSHWELSSSGYNPDGASEHGRISDDSEDAPYCYTSHPDLEFETDSDETDSVALEILL